MSKRTKPQPITEFRDQFNARVRVGDLVAYARKDIGNYGSSNIGVNFAKVTAFTAKFVRLRSIQGEELSLGLLGPHTLAKIDDKLMQRLMLTKLSS